MVFVKKDGAYKSIAFSKSSTLDVSMNLIDASTKDSGNGMWQNQEPGLASWTVQTDNLMSDKGENGASFNDLMDAFLKREPVELVFGLQTNSPDYSAKLDTPFTAPEGGWTPDTQNHIGGNALITSLNVTAQNGEYATMSATFTGCGNLQKKGNGIQSGAAAASLAAAPGTKVTTTTK